MKRKFCRVIVLIILGIMFIQGLINIGFAYADDSPPPSATVNQEATSPENIKGSVKNEDDLLNNIQGVLEPQGNATTGNATSAVSKIPENITSDTELKLPDLKSTIEMNLKIDSLPTDLPTVLKIAIENNYNLRTIVAVKDATKWDYYNASSTWLPDINYSYYVAHQRGIFVSNQLFGSIISLTPVNSVFTFNWNAFTGFRRYFLIKTAKNNYESKQNTLAFTKEQIILNATTQYYQLLRTKLKIEIQMRNFQQTDAQVKITQQQFDAGIGTKFDLLRAQAENAKAKQSLLYAYNNFRLAQAQLANTMGIAVFAPLYPVEKAVDEKKLVDTKYKLEELNTLSMNTRFDIKAAKCDVAAAKSFKNASYSAYLPQANVYYQEAYAGARQYALDRNYGINFMLNWTGGNGLGLTAFTEIQKRKAVLRQKELELANLSRNAQQSLLNSYYSTYTAEAIVQAAREEVKSAKESLRLAFVRLQAGVGIYVDVLQAQTTATNSKNNLLDAIIAYNVSQAQLLFDMGVIDENNVLNGYKKKQP